MLVAETTPIPIVIVHWNQPESCLSTVEAFRASTVPVRIIIIDNGSDATRLEQLRCSLCSIAVPGVPRSADSTGASSAAIPSVELVETGTNLGFGPGANVGLARFLADDSAGEWVVVAPHDVDPEPGCLESMLRAAGEHPMAGLMCADVGDGMVPVIDPYFGGMVVEAHDLSLDGPRWEPVDYPHGTLMMASRACLAEVGLFDERYFSYCEEAQLATRAKASGFDIGLIRGARVTNTHIGSGAAIVDYLQTRNTLLFVLEHSGAYHAFIRFCIALLQLLTGIASPDRRPLIFDARARILGMRDFLLRRFGPPPPQI